MDIPLVLKVLNYSTLSSAPLRTSIKPSWKWVKTSLQVTFELLFGELKHPHPNHISELTDNWRFSFKFYRSMRVTIFNVCAILSLFSVTIHAAPQYGQVSPRTIPECPIHPIIGPPGINLGHGPVCIPGPTSTWTPYDGLNWWFPFLTGLQICRLRSWGIRWSEYVYVVIELWFNYFHKHIYFSCKLLCGPSWASVNCWESYQAIWASKMHCRWSSALWTAYHIVGRLTMRHIAKHQKISRGTRDVVPWPEVGVGRFIPKACRRA